MTITAKELFEATMRGEGPLAKHAAANPDMPVFLLLGQDVHAADLVEKWAIWSNVADVSAKKAAEAKTISEAMRAWPHHKLPD